MNEIIHNPSGVGHTLYYTQLFRVWGNTIDIGLKCQHFIGGKGIRPSHLAVPVYIYIYIDEPVVLVWSSVLS